MWVIFVLPNKCLQGGPEIQSYVIQLLPTSKHRPVNITLVLYILSGMWWCAGAWLCYFWSKVQNWYFVYLTCGSKIWRYFMIYISILWLNSLFLGCSTCLEYIWWQVQITHKYLFLLHSLRGHILLLQEWPEEVYPPYANGPAYVISSDIVTFILSQHKDRRLRVS